MIISCPHCFIEVSPAKDGTCPACKKNTTVIDPEKADLLLAEFVDGERLPQLCFVCGKPSSGLVECGQRNEQRRLDPVEIPRLWGVLTAVAALMNALKPPQQEAKKFALSVQLPVCQSHSQRAPIEPVHVDTRAARLQFPVHKALDAAWVANQSRAPRARN